ncbi:MAG: hypothetical protein JJE17_03670 [Peptostreptococcaceae bacterium]|nr:hypothetical protein [Peptostreptococcaceae bacterium]
MARTKSIDSFEQKIEKAKETVDRAKVKYEVAVEELERLMTMREGLRKEQLINVITNSGKSFDEVMSFLGK